MEKLLYRPRRKPDKAAKNCEQCGEKFTLTFRRHHCRCCGGVFCTKCTTHKRYLSEMKYRHPRRVCDACFKKSSTKIMDEVFARISVLPPDIQEKLHAGKKLSDDDTDETSSDGENMEDTDQYIGFINPAPESTHTTITEFPTHDPKKVNPRKKQNITSVNVLGDWSITSLVSDPPAMRTKLFGQEETIVPIADTDKTFIILAQEEVKEKEEEGYDEASYDEKGFKEREKEEERGREKSAEAIEEAAVIKKARKPVSEWTVEDVCNWLMEMKLGVEVAGYVERAMKMQLDGKALQNLKKEDLADEEKLDIPSFGHRKKIWHAIEGLTTPPHEKVLHS